MRISNQRLISDLISALCGEEYEEADNTMAIIKESGDESLIKEAEYICSIM